MLVLFPEKSSEGALEGMHLAAKALPSLLPFAVFSGCVIYSGAARVVGAVAAPVFCRLFNVSPYGAAAFVTGLLGGYPTGVKAVCDTYDKGLIGKSEAERLLSFCNNSGAVFILNVAGAGAFGSVKTGLTLYIIHIASAVIAGIFMRGKGRYTKKMSVRAEYRAYRKEKMPAMRVLGKSLVSSGGAMVQVCSAIIVFNAVTAAFSIEDTWLCGMVEMTKGVFFAGRRGIAALASLYISWGGLSVHAQAAAIAGKYELSLSKHFKGKVLSAVTAACLTLALARGC